MKTLVTHISPDVDAIAACWLVKKFLPGWKDAEIVLVPAGETLDKMEVDSNPDIIHVDTGLGKFDHHQDNTKTCAAKLVFEYLKKQNLIPWQMNDALERLIAFINTTDHFGEAHFVEATSDIYDFTLHQLTLGLNHTQKDDQDVIRIVFTLLEAALQILRNKVRAENELRKGIVFESRWGKSIAMETKNEEALKLGMKMGYELVLRKDPEKGGVRIKSLPSNKSDLSLLYDKLISIDTVGVWYLHQSHNMLLNASSINSRFIPTPLTLPQLIEIIKEM